jgi:hypothetical protein
LGGHVDSIEGELGPSILAHVKVGHPLEELLQIDARWVNLRPTSHSDYNPVAPSPVCQPFSTASASNSDVEDRKVHVMASFFRCVSLA